MGFDLQEPGVQAEDGHAIVAMLAPFLSAWGSTVSFMVMIGRENGTESLEETSDGFQVGKVDRDTVEMGRW